MNSRGWGSVKGKDDGKRDARGKGGVASLEMLTERELAAETKLTAEFIAGLSVTHPSTVSTINRTGEKLVFPGDADKTLCPVCEQ
jgi:cytoplasmic tRNA 2-thiolation protein 2